MSSDVIQFTVVTSCTTKGVHVFFGEADTPLQQGALEKLKSATKTGVKNKSQRRARTLNVGRLDGTNQRRLVIGQILSDDHTLSREAFTKLVTSFLKDHGYRAKEARLEWVADLVTAQKS